MSAGRATAPSRWWHGVASPGVGGYALAFLVSALALMVIFLLEGLPELFGDFSVEELAVSVGTLVLGTGYALFYGWPAAIIGCLAVHLVCLRVPEQPVHVLMAGLAGLVTGVIYAATLFSGTFVVGFAVELGVATALGRAAVIPLTRGRASRRTS